MSWLDILKDYVDTLEAAVGAIEGGTALHDKLTVARANLLDEITAARMEELDGANLPADIDALLTRLSATRAGYLDNIAETAKGRAQIASTTIDLNQAANTYDLFTGTTQNVIVEGLVIRMPTDIAAGALTSISIQTDDVTPLVFITSAEGAVANLVSEAQLSWAPADGVCLLVTGKKIRLTIGGGAEGAAYVCTVVAKYRAVVSGGYLA